MLDIEEVDYSIPRVFQKRSTAIKNVLENMSVGDREDVVAEVDKFKRTALPSELQKR